MPIPPILPLLSLQKMSDVVDMTSGVVCEETPARPIIRGLCNAVPETRARCGKMGVQIFRYQKLNLQTRRPPLSTNTGVYPHNRSATETDGLHDRQVPPNIVE